MSVTTYRRELTRADMERMRIPRRLWSARLDAISEAPWAVGEKSPRELITCYLSKLEKMRARGLGMLLWGKNGTGKSAGAVVIAKEFRRRGYAVLFFEAASLKDAVINKLAFDEMETVWERARSVPVLILDDLGKGTQDGVGFGARLLDDLLRHRSANKLVTFITTNMNPRKTLKTELNESTMSTLKECMIPVQITGDDRRNEAQMEHYDFLTG